MSATKLVQNEKLYYRVKNININKKDMLSLFPFAHCHFRIGNSLLLDDFTFLKKTKVCKMFINSQNVKGKNFDFFLCAKYRKISYWRIFANIIASIWAHIFITER